MKLLLVIVDVLFAVAEAVSGIADRRKAAKRDKGLTLRDLVAMKRADDDLARRTNARTVVIPPPSERERPKPR